ncbi:hypothetical protein ASG43_17735 [Aureimonas sp. Leaf454]|nr:hypothetical protein ASG43_17735 [Aureimonas sp. Leaf454]
MSVGPSCSSNDLQRFAAEIVERLMCRLGNRDSLPAGGRQQCLRRSDAGAGRSGCVDGDGGQNTSRVDEGWIDPGCVDALQQRRLLRRPAATASVLCRFFHRSLLRCIQALGPAWAALDEGGILDRRNFHSARTISAWGTL